MPRPSLLDSITLISLKFGEQEEEELGKLSQYSV
jgi:hypothetical protein